MQRVLRDTGANIDLTFQSDESGLAADGAVTVNIARENGTSLVANGTTTHQGSGVYRYALIDTYTQLLDVLKFDWTGTFGGLVQTQTSYVEVVGGYYFSLTEARAIEGLTDSAVWPTAKLRDGRTEVEEECESICGVAFVPRYARERLSGNDGSALLLPHTRVRSIRSLRVYSDATTYTAYDATDLADLNIDAGILHRFTRGTFTSGVQSIVVEYEHGYDRPPTDLKRASLQRLRSLLNTHRSGIPDRATSYVHGEGGTFRLDMPSADKTGIPYVDAVYHRYSERVPGMA